MDAPKVNAALVRRLLAAQFPQWAGLPITKVEPGGRDNTTFRLGPDMSVRLPSAPEYALQVDKEHRWLPVLAARLPIAIPEPRAKGSPGCGFPLPWSVYGWLEGEPATRSRIADPVRCAAALAEFLMALYAIDPADGPAPGQHNFFRGALLSTYDDEARQAIGALRGEIDAAAALGVWEAALDAQFLGPAVWVHGDVSAGNLLVRDGRLSAVIDFGCAAVGDPACDVTIAWTLFTGDARNALHARLGVDDETWARGRGWALWKAAITLVPGLDVSRQDPAEARRVLVEVLADSVGEG